MEKLEIFYLCCAVIGIVLVMASLFGGADHDHSFDHDFDHDGHLDSSEHGPSFLSYRVMVTFVTAFGAFGFLTSYLLKVGPLWSTLSGVGGGFVIAIFIWWLISIAFKQQASSLVTSEDILGAEGVVLTAIPVGEGYGEVSLEVKGQRKNYPAQMIDNTSCASGTMVVVKTVTSGHVIVEIK